MSWRDSPIVYLTSKMWRFSEGNRRHVLLYFIMFICANIVGFFEPLVLAKILNIIQEFGITGESIYSIIGYASLFIFLAIGFWIFHGPARVIEVRNAFLVRANYQKYLLDGTMSLPLEWHTDHHSGDTIDKINNAADGLFRYSGETFLVIETLVRFSSSYLALIYFNLHSSYIVAVMVFLTITIILKFDSVLREYYKSLNKARNTISAKVFDVISNITTVVILRIEKLLSKEIFRKIMQPLSLFTRTQKINETKWFCVSVCTSIQSFLVIATFILSSYLAGVPILIGTVSALFQYVRRINDLFFRFAWKYGEIVRWKVNVENGQEIAKDFKAQRKIKPINLSKWKKLHIANLSFSYIGAEGELHLRNINLVINRNEKIALIGESGSGKTTFLKLFRGLYKPKSVKICLDEKCIKEGFDALSSHITLIPQEPEIFATTVKENITVGVRHAMKHVLKFTNMAQFTKVANKLPQKFKSSIVEKGVNLSGGEKQRLALSRGLLAAEDKPIVLFDEPTSSVDPKTERDIYRNVFRAFKNKTIISTIHRLHLLNDFDKVYMFKQGRIVAAGTLKELKKSSKDFQRMWKKYHKKH